MSDDAGAPTRRSFMQRIGQATSVTFLASLGFAVGARAEPATARNTSLLTGEWDLTWLQRVASGTDRAVFDWPTLGSPADPIMLELAERYLQNCAAAYGVTPYAARVVLNIRTQAVPAALNDSMWERYALGAVYKTTDPTTGVLAVRNPFWHRAPDPAAGIALPSLADLQQTGAIILVCDFALTNLAKRLAATINATAAEVHAILRANLVPGAIAMPSGIFGLVRAQNAGCALVHL